MLSIITDLIPLFIIEKQYKGITFSPLACTAEFMHTTILFSKGCLYCFIATNTAIAVISEPNVVPIAPNAIQNKFQSKTIPPYSNHFYIPITTTFLFPYHLKLLSNNVSTSS